MRNLTLRDPDGTVIRTVRDVPDDLAERLLALLSLWSTDDPTPDEARSPGLPPESYDVVESNLASIPSSGPIAQRLQSLELHSTGLYHTDVDYQDAWNDALRTACSVLLRTL